MKYFIFLCSLVLSISVSAQQADYDRAWAAYTSGRYEEALISIQECIAADSTNYQYVFLKGKVLENLYRFADAIDAQQTVLSMNPGGLDATAALATLYLQSGQPAVSAQYYEQLVNAEPEIVRWKMNLATALQASGKHDLALKQLKIVEQKDTTNWLVYKNMGDCYYRIDSVAQAFHHYYISLKLYPQNKTLWGVLTRALVAKDLLDAAVEVGNEAVNIDSTNVEGWKYLGIAYSKLGKVRRAHNALAKTLALGDSSLTTYSYYGIVNYHLYNYQEAETYLIKARKIDSKDIALMNYLASTYGYTGKPQEGLEIFSELDRVIADIDSVGMKANIQRGYLLRLLRRYNDAANSYITGTKDFPKESRNFYEVAVCYDMDQNKKLALEWYSRYLDVIDPEWATKQWTVQELKKNELVKIAIDRVEGLKVDLFFEQKMNSK